jgi:RNA polymerase sigma factor (TIGR02999 family)
MAFPTGTPPERPDPSLTERLRRYSGGDNAVAEELFREILPKLHELAVRALSRERYVAPVSPTELIGELWLRNLRKGGWRINDREHFYALSALAMRHVLIDLARNRLAQIRGRGETEISGYVGVVPDPATTQNIQSIVEMGQLMGKLEQKDPVAARIVDLKYFAGYTIEEIAEITGLGERHIRHRWKKAQDWLKDQMPG